MKFQIFNTVKKNILIYFFKTALIIAFEHAFCVSESDKADYNSLHVHMLIDTNTDVTYKEVKYGLRNVSEGDYQPVYDNEMVCKYISKHIGKDVDYDIVFKS